MKALQSATGHVTPKRALEVMSLMEAAGITTPDSKSYEMLLDAYVAGGWYSKALALVEKMKAQGGARLEGGGAQGLEE